MREKEGKLGKMVWPRWLEVQGGAGLRQAVG